MLKCKESQEEVSPLLKSSVTDRYPNVNNAEFIMVEIILQIVFRCSFLFKHFWGR